MAASVNFKLQFAMLFTADGYSCYLFWSWAADTQVIEPVKSLYPLHSSHLLYSISFCLCFFCIFRSLDDVRMNLEVLKHCATVLFLVIQNVLVKFLQTTTHPLL